MRAGAGERWEKRGSRAEGGEREGEEDRREMGEERK